MERRTVQHDVFWHDAMLVGDDVATHSPSWRRLSVSRGHPALRQGACAEGRDFERQTKTSHVYLPKEADQKPDPTACPMYQVKLWYRNFSSVSWKGPCLRATAS